MAKSGFVSIIGRPNVGKSTFLNSALGNKISIVSKKPQTTRDRIMGIFNDQRGQVVFVDSPGIHKPKRDLNRRMVKEASNAIDDCDLILHMTDNRLFRFIHEEELVFDAIGNKKSKKILVINKIDLMTLEDRGKILDFALSRVDYERIMDTNSKGGFGVHDVVDLTLSLLPEGPPYFPEDYLSDRGERFHLKEIIREKLFHELKEELPYSIAVSIEEVRMEEEKDMTSVMATIYVERESQKGIVIGKKGALIKKVGISARQEMESLLQAKVFLDLRVKVEKGWSRKEYLLKRLGY